MNWLIKISQQLCFWGSCVDWPEQYIDALHYLVDNGRKTTRDIFLLHVKMSPEDAEQYIPDGDWHIQYYHLGPDIWWYVHSAIEHVFATEESIQRVQKIIEAKQ